MVKKVNLNASSIRAEASGMIENQTQKAKLNQTPKDVQEDIIREYLQSKDKGTTRTEFRNEEGKTKTADYKNYIEAEANGITKSIIDQIDKKGYSSWNKAVRSEVSEYYRNSPVQKTVNKLESEINKHAENIDFTDVLGQRAENTKRATVSSTKKLGQILKKIIEVVGAKSFWLVNRLTAAGLRTGRILGLQAAFFGCFCLVFGSLFLGVVQGPAAALRSVGVFTVFIGGGLGLSVSCRALAKKLDIYMPPV